MSDGKLNDGDKALIHAATTGSGLVELTPDLMKELDESIRTRTANILERHPKLVQACDYETRLAVTAQVFAAVCEHAQEGGTFRYLIYDRLGFNSDAYLPLYNAGGMMISNEFSLQEITDLRAALAARDEQITELTNDRDSWCEQADERVTDAVTWLKRVRELEAGWQAACAFIDSHAADPDLTEKMCRTYAEFQKARALLAPPATKEPR